MHTKLSDLIAATKATRPDIDPQIIVEGITSLDGLAFDDPYGVRRVAGSNKPLEEIVRELYGAPNARKPAESVDDERAKFGGYTKHEFEALPPDARLRIHGENTAPVQASWQSKSAPVSRNEILQKTGLTGADFDALPLQRRLEIENEVRFTRGAQ